MAPTRIIPSNQVHLQTLGTTSVPVIFSGAAARVFHRSFLARLDTTNWKPSTCQHFISFLVSALLYVTCFRYSNVDLGKSRGCLQRGSHIRIQGFTRFVRDGVEDKWHFFGCSLMFYTFLSATCVNTWRLVVHCFTSVSKHIQKMNLWKMYLLLVLSLNDFQLKLRECGEAHEHPQELHFNDVHPGPMGIHETERLIRATLYLHFLWSSDSPICLDLQWP